MIATAAAQITAAVQDAKGQPPSKVPDAAAHVFLLHLYRSPGVCCYERVMRLHAEQEQRVSMAAAFAQLPCKVLWRLTPSEVPDGAAIAALHLGNNTKVCSCLPSTHHVPV